MGIESLQFAEPADGSRRTAPRSAEGDRQRRLPSAHDFPAIAFALVLLVASGLKVEQFFSQQPIHSATQWRRSLDLAPALMESLLAAWLLSGINARGARRAAIVFLAVFLLVALFHVLAGDQDCRCFGSLAVHPRVDDRT